MPEPAIAIVGVGHSDYGVVPGMTAYQHHHQAAMRALEDAGLHKGDIDGLFSPGKPNSGMMPPVALAEYLGLRPRYADGGNFGGSVWETFVRHAVSALRAGYCDYAMLCYGSDLRSGGGTGLGTGGENTVTMAGPFQFEGPFGLPLVGRAALAARRHMFEFGTTSEQLAAIAVSTRRNASRNPKAMYRELITVDDVMSSRVIADPLHKLDCCLITDGGGAVILTTAERAQSCASTPVWVLGSGEAWGTVSSAGWTDFLDLPAVRSAAEAYREAGLGPSDIDVVELYDSYTSTVLLQLEALGFCPRGEGGPFVEGGRLAFDGELPTNTDGGGLSSNHPGMRGIFLLIEAVRQLRGTADAQVEGAEVALCNGVGGPTSTCGTVILGADR
jgi:acetyl-CoA acetyltransferase